MTNTPISIIRNAGATRANSTAETPRSSLAMAKRLADTDHLRIGERLRQVEELDVRRRAPRPGRGEGVDHVRREVVGAVADAVGGRAAARADLRDADIVARGRRDPGGVYDVLDL